MYNARPSYKTSHFRPPLQLHFPLLLNMTLHQMLHIQSVCDNPSIPGLTHDLLPCIHLYKNETDQAHIPLPLHVKLAYIFL